MSLIERLNRRGDRTLPGLVGVEILAAEEGRITAASRCETSSWPRTATYTPPRSSLADTSCGYGCFVNLPEGASSFTTVELKSNFLATKREGAIACEATLVHGGRATQEWEGTVSDEGAGKKVALFRCPQTIL